MSSRVSDSAAAAETQIDNAYKSNSLLTLPLTTAMWYVLAAYEVSFQSYVTDESPTTVNAALANNDNVMNQAKWSMAWIASSCKIGGEIPRRIDWECGAGTELVLLAHRYRFFVIAYTLARRGVVSLDTTGNTLVPRWELNDLRRDAYDRVEDPASDASVSYDQEKMFELATKSLTGSPLSCRLNPKLVRSVSDLVDGEFDRRFALPGDWTIAGLRLDEFKCFFRALWSVSKIHVSARNYAQFQGVPFEHNVEPLVRMSHTEFVNRIRRYSGLDESIVRMILDYLTYGGQGIAKPDPVLQPLMRPEHDCLMWSPSLILQSSLERNLLVLLNRIEKGKSDYSVISNKLEQLQRDKLKATLTRTGLRVLGPLSIWDLELDAAIVSDSEDCALVLELKHFFYPADPAEVIHKTSEIEHGIEQITVRRERGRQDPASLGAALGLTESAEVEWAVASENTIGGSWVPIESVAVVRLSHIVKQVITSGLSETMRWIRNRNYLPQEGKDFEVVTCQHELPDWTLEWHGFRFRD